MISRQLKTRINNIILMNRKIRPKSASFGMLSLFYGGAKTQEIISEFSKKTASINARKNICRNLHYLQSIGLLKKHSSRPISYEITDRGRWYVIASRLGVPLFSLILLANIYVFQKNMMERGRLDYYVVGFFFEKIRHFVAHPHRVHGTLIRKNYLSRCANQTVRIPRDVFEKIREFESDFESIHKWYQDTGDEIDSVLIKTGYFGPIRSTVHV